MSVGYVTERVRSFCSIGHLNDRLRQKAPRRCFTFRLLHDQNRRVEKKVFYLKLCFPYSDGVLFDKTFIKVNKLRGRAGNERIYFASFGYFALVTSNNKWLTNSCANRFLSNLFPHTYLHYLVTRSNDYTSRKVSFIMEFVWKVVADVAFTQWTSPLI